MQIARLQQPFLNPRLDPLAEERAVGQDDGRLAAVLEDVHDQGQEEIGRFLCLVLCSESPTPRPVPRSRQRVDWSARYPPGRPAV